MKVVRRLLILILVIAVAAVAVRLMLPVMARRLIRSDALQRSDVIVVLGSSRYERTIEAGKLYREGWAPRIFLLRPPDPLRDTLRQQMNLKVPVFLDVQLDLLRQLQVPSAAIMLSSETPEATYSEAHAVAAAARQNGWHRVIVVTSPYHTARAGALFDDALKGSCEVFVRPNRFEIAKPDRWWLTFPDRYDVVHEILARIYSLVVRR